MKNLKSKLLVTVVAAFVSSSVIAEPVVDYKLGDGYNIMGKNLTATSTGNIKVIDNQGIEYGSALVSPGKSYFIYIKGQQLKDGMKIVHSPGGCTIDVTSETIKGNNVFERDFVYDGNCHLSRKASNLPVTPYLRALSSVSEIGRDTVEIHIERNRGIFGGWTTEARYDNIPALTPPSTVMVASIIAPHRPEAILWKGDRISRMHAVNNSVSRRVYSEPVTCVPVDDMDGCRQNTLTLGGQGEEKDTTTITPRSREEIYKQ